jgi:predicted MFS family arabinose efflux permease
VTTAAPPTTLDPATTAPPGSSEPSGPPAPARGLRRMAAALTYRDFRIVWLGALVSTVGTWMQKVAQSWLVLTLAGTSSAFYLGLDSFLGEAPILLLTLVGGVVADRLDRRHILMASQVVQMSTALALAALVYTDQVRIWHVLALSVITGVAQAFGGPAHHSLMPSLVPKEHLPNAIAFNAIQFNVARVIGPLISGAALAAFGMAVCFGLNGLSFVAVLIGLLLLGPRPPAGNQAKSLKDEMRGGFAYLRSDPSLVGLAALGFMGTFLGSPLLTFLPAFVQDVLHGDVTQYTRLMSFAGAGAVVGALGVAWLGKVPHMGRMVLSLQIAMGLVIVLFANTREPIANSALLFTGGACMVMVFAMLQSLVQLNAPNELRGRVMSIYMMAFRGGMPLGSLVGGWLANQFTAPPVLMVNGALLAAVAAWFLVRGHSIREL